MAEQLKTFAQWANEGRAVRKGQRAQLYAVNDDWSKGYALFDYEQTEPLEEEPETDEWQRVPVEEWRKHKDKKPPKKPRILIDYDKDAGELVIWCGNDKGAIESLKRGFYRFDLTTHRWRAAGKDPHHVVRGFENHCAKDGSLRFDVVRSARLEELLAIGPNV